MNFRILFLILSSTFLWSQWCSAQEVEVQNDSAVLQNISSSFERDLTKYFFGETPAGAKVDYELLRQGPTQVGVAYPEYYIWIKASKNKNIITEGSARLQQTDRAQFLITDYINLQTIRENPSALEKVFPKALIQNILTRAENAK
jgi:hypothetical protein